MRAESLEPLARAVTEGLRSAPPITWESRATGYYDLPHENLGLMGIVIEPTAELRRAQSLVIEAVAPFGAETGTAEAFAPRLEGRRSASRPWTTCFVGARTGVRYNPHLTRGLGNPASSTHGRRSRSSPSPSVPSP